MELPPEILFKIFDLLPSSTLISLTLVCRVWKAVSVKLLYSVIEHHAWKPRRVSSCLKTLASSHDPSLSTTVRHLDLRLWSVDPEFAHLVILALIQTTNVTKLKLSMSETFSQNFEHHLLSNHIIAFESVDEKQPDQWSKRFLPHLQCLELSPGFRPFQLTAGRPVRAVISPTHIQLEALQQLMPFFQCSLGPLQSVHFNLTGRDTKVASTALKMVARKLPCLTHVFFNFFVSKRANPPKFTPDLLEDLSPLSSLRSVELLLSRHARSTDPYLYSHFAAVHTLKATSPHLMHVILDTIRWQYRPPPQTGPPFLTHSASSSSTSASTSSSSEPDPISPSSSSDHGHISGSTYGWSPQPSDPRTHVWWLGQYGNVTSAHMAMMALWRGQASMGRKDGKRGVRYEEIIPEPHEIGVGLYTQSLSNDSMSIYEI